MKKVIIQIPLVKPSYKDNRERSFVKFFKTLEKLFLDSSGLVFDYYSVNCLMHTIEAKVKKRNLKKLKNICNNLMLRVEINNKNINIMCKKRLTIKQLIKSRSSQGEK